MAVLEKIKGPDHMVQGDRQLRKDPIPTHLTLIMSLMTMKI